jgi:tetratricopeptide (TPR) repeat protein
MQHDPILAKALNFARSRKYGQAIKALEDEIVRYQDSFQYHYLLGLCCLYAGDFGGAFTYLNRAKSIKFREPGPLLGLALYFLRRGDTEKAVGLYLEVQDLDAGSKIARRALNLIRRAGSEEISTRIQGGKAFRLYPRFPGRRRTVFVLAAVLAAVLLGSGLFFFARTFPEPQRGGMEDSALDGEERLVPVETGSVYRYVLTVDEVISCYNEARLFFNKYRDEKAKYNLNRLLESNASTAVKNKARLLKSFTAAPGFDTLKDRFSYTEVNGESVLYRDCYVIWKGMAANIVREEDRTSFDLLVGYDTRTVMEGAVRVEMAFPADINAALPLEVLGKIIILSGNSAFILEAAGIHQIPVK